MTNLQKTALSAVAGFGMVAAYRRATRIDLAGKSVVITGGSRGLGLELAREFGDHGARLALLARDPEELERARALLTGADVITVPCDIRDADAVAQAIDVVFDRRGAVDVLVNDAGIIDVAPIDNLDEADFEDSLATHFWGPLHLIRAVVDRMDRGSRIVNISSIGGLVSVPHLLSYAAGKFALTGLSEGLSTELAQREIYVTTVCPGLMRTGSHVKARFKGRHQEEFAWFSLSSAFPLASTPSRRAARKIVTACRDARPFLVITPQARALHLLHAIAPNTITRAMRLVARLLPEARGPAGDQRHEGWQSRSDVAPSPLTSPADGAIERNNELTEAEKKEYFRGE